MKPNIILIHDELLIEWTDKDWRFGLWLDPKDEKEKAGWYFVSKEHEGESGPLDENFIAVLKEYLK